MLFDCSAYKGPPDPRVPPIEKILYAQFGAAIPFLRQELRNFVLRKI